MLDPAPFLRKLFSVLDENGVDVLRSPLDHLCYRVENDERYQALRNALDREGILLGENQIGGRPIATYRLNKPFLFDGRSIDVLELPAPKPGSPYQEGYEHAEFVVDEDLLAFIQRYPKLAWDISAIGKTINADVRLRFEGYSVKLPRRALAAELAADPD